MSTLQHPATPDRFLAEYEPQRDWRLPAGLAGLDPVASFDGRGNYALEVALATAVREPPTGAVRELWTKRHENAPNPLLLIVAFQDGNRWHASLCGPAGDQPPVIARIDLSQAERLAEAALSEPSRHAAIRFLTAMLPEVGADLPGLRNHGMFASHELRDRVPEREDWRQLCDEARPLLGHRGRDLIERLGFRVEEHGTTTSVLAAGDQKRAVAVFLDEGDVFEEPTLRFEGASPVAHALAAADREGLPWAVLTRGRQIRVYSARPDVGVGRKGRAETFVEANLALLPDEQAGYLSLLFSAAALLPGGSFEQVLDESRDYAADLSTRLRDRVYKDAVPALATALAERRGEATLDEVYEQALNVLFRLLFVAYAEDKDLLPYRSNGLYRERSLKALARRLADRRQDKDLLFDPNDTSLWDDVAGLWRAIDIGNVELGVPAYNGGLFSGDPQVNRAGAALAQARLSNAEFGPALTALVVDETDDGVVGPVDFRSLSVREFGTVYEGLLESSLSVALTDLSLDTKANYVPARDGDQVVVSKDAVYFHNRSGARKASGSYFTKPFAVEHLLDHALEPALDDHIARLGALLDAGEDAKAAQAFFDFRCVDLAMGSGHFLVAAVDRIEARLSAFLAERPIPQLAAELERLRAAAYEALGPLGEGVELEHSSLLRRQVARRCVYGVDRNVIAVELARLAIWIHTFVPGLPLSFLDHALVAGDSLNGIGTLDEALQALDPGDDTWMSIFREPILAVLARAENALTRLGRLSDATAGEIKDARAAQAEAQTEVQSARDLFDLIVAARLGTASLPTAFDEDSIRAHPDRAAANELRRVLGCLHFPIAFPEVFLRERAGFDVLIGNPPWEKLQVERHAFWGLRFPGLRGLNSQDMELEIARLEEERPDLAAEFDEETARVSEARALLLSGPYPGLGASHPDLYKAFAWRFWQLVAIRGRIGVVLPRVATGAAGMADWRRHVLAEGAFSDLTALVNRGGWVFDDAEPRYTIVLASLARGVDSDVVPLQGPFFTPEAFAARGASVALPTRAILELPELVIPLLSTQTDADTFAEVRAAPRLDDRTQRWWARSVQGDFNSTTGKGTFSLDQELHEWPVYKGASFELWRPETGDLYGSIDPKIAQKELLARRAKLRGRANSVFSDMPADWFVDQSTLPCLTPRVAYRRISRATDTRTMIAALVPSGVVLVDTAPYLVFAGDASPADVAYTLGMLCSLPLDWFVRRIAEAHVDGFVVNSLPIPRPPVDDPRRERVISISGQLAARDDRYGEWAKEIGVAVNSVSADDERRLVAELDALAAHLYGLNEQRVRHIFETFHAGWNYEPRLRQVLDHFERLT